jgi:DnaJ-class molecular chaperone
MKDYYAILGVPQDSSIRQIKRTYKKLAKDWHPDLHPKDSDCRTKIQEINEAYEVLGDPQKTARL